jgi:inorganic pyrophosphatase
MHIWHDLSPGEASPETVNAIIEIPKGSKAKYELEKESGLLKLDRVLFSSVHYPANYGFIPQTLCDDKDPLDILVLSQIDIQPLCLVEAKTIGVMHMVDSDESDDKIIAVAANDPSVNHFDDIWQLPPHLISELQNFFEEYKKLEKKKVEVKEFQNRDIALKIIEESVQMYKEKYN